MSAAKHTPGPWNAVPSTCETGWLIGPRETNGPDYVADVHKLTHGRSDEDSEANARLIAAAPDLLAACEALAKIADAYDANALDDDARKSWGPNLEHQNDTPPEQVEIYRGRGGKRLLTLADCFAARAAIAKAVGP